MSVVYSLSESSQYEVATPVYQGPLDLLLQLIERAELDITKLSLAQVTDQYLIYIKNLSQLSAEDVSAFLVIAARLIQIKSEMLLPRPPSRDEGEEDPGELLARQLLLYRQFKTVASSLDKLQRKDQRTYTSYAPVPDIESKFQVSGLDIFNLRDTYLDVFSRKPEEPASLDEAIKPPRFTIRHKIRLVADNLRRFGKTKFRALLGQQFSREEIGVTFLAILELVKLNFIQTSQENLFSEIEITALGGWEEKDEIELEFGE
jgi:segregation and condensation protein A